MRSKKRIFIGLVCFSAVLVVLYWRDSITMHGFGKTFNWRNGYGIMSVTQKIQNSTTGGELSDSASQTARSRNTHLAAEHINVSDDVWTTAMLATTTLNSTPGPTTYSVPTALNEMKTTNYIRYGQQGNYSYTLPHILRQAMQDRFLFPVLLFGGGPSFQYRQLKKALEFAVFTNRTIVVSDFRHHRTNYIAKSVSFEDTFNISVLNQLLPTVNVKQFREKCGARINTIWTFYKPGSSNSSSIELVYQSSRDWLSDRANVDIPDVTSVTFPKSIPESWREIDKTADDRCVVMVSPVGFEAVHLPNEAAMSDAIDGHLVRTSFLQKAAEDVLPKLCDGEPILGFHWRNKTGERCRIGTLAHTNDPKCHQLLEIQYSILESLALKIPSIMSQENAGCIFIASAPREPQENILRHFTSHNFSSIIMIDDVINLHNPDVDTFADDDYFISLIEQEICARSKVFVGFSMSNWSNFVFRERRAFQRGTNYDLVHDFPGFPKNPQWYL
ncbi:uncharacterized protein [Ptychodera flava]|uniref:uncharacterized protein n=1 Tax=Ptychodera flava TaxID=63121 RepID=UPI003969EA5B